MHDNAPSHAEKTTGNYLQKIGFKNGRVMVWPPFSPDLNPIENLRSIIKTKVYVSAISNENGVMGCHIDRSISTTANNIFLEEIQNLTDLMDKCLISVISYHGGYIHM